MVDRGQIKGGFVRGAGLLTLEELLWDGEGRLATNGASTYKLPSWPEMPEAFRVNFLKGAAESGVAFGSKAAGESPLMLVISVREAILELDSPCTPERIFFALRKARATSSAPAAVSAGVGQS